MSGDLALQLGTAKHSFNDTCYIRCTIVSLGSSTIVSTSTLLFAHVSVFVGDWLRVEYPVLVLILDGLLEAVGSAAEQRAKHLLVDEVKHAHHLRLPLYLR